jgi:GH18 family chitinase
MNRFRFFPIICLALAGLMAAASPASAQSDQEKIQQQLESLMAKESPLSEEDVRIYLANVDPIFRLRAEPGRLGETARSIGGWSESRFAYVTTKIAVGMSLLLRPTDARHSGIPAFARPDAQEMALLRRYQEELGREMEAAQLKYGVSP